MDNQNFDAIVIGSGLGGLTAGALYAQQGKRVLVVERHDKQHALGPRRISIRLGDEQPRVGHVDGARGPHVDAEEARVHVANRRLELLAGEEVPEASIEPRGRGVRAKRRCVGVERVQGLLEGVGDGRNAGQLLGRQFLGVAPRDGGVQGLEGLLCRDERCLWARTTGSSVSRKMSAVS